MNEGESFKALSDEATQLLERFVALADALSEESLASVARKQIRRLSRAGFTVIVLAESSDKSADFLNALLGRGTVVPHDRPPKAAPVRLVYGEDTGITVRLGDGMETYETVEAADLGAALRRHYALGATGLAEELILHVPHPLCREGVEFLELNYIESLRLESTRIEDESHYHPDAVLICLEPGRWEKTLAPSLIKHLIRLVNDRIFLVVTTTDSNWVGRETAVGDEVRRELHGLLDDPRVYFYPGPGGAGQALLEDAIVASFREIDRATYTLIAPLAWARTRLEKNLVPALETNLERIRSGRDVEELYARLRTVMQQLEAARQVRQGLIGEGGEVDRSAEEIAHLAVDAAGEEPLRRFLEKEAYPRLARFSLAALAKEAGPRLTAELELLLRGYVERQVKAVDQHWYALVVKQSPNAGSMVARMTVGLREELGPPPVPALAGVSQWAAESLLTSRVESGTGEQALMMGGVAGVLLGLFIKGLTSAGIGWFAPLLMAFLGAGAARLGLGWWREFTARDALKVRIKAALLASQGPIREYLEGYQRRLEEGCRELLGQVLTDQAKDLDRHLTNLIPLLERRKEEQIEDLPAWEERLVEAHRLRERMSSLLDVIHNQPEPSLAVNQAADEGDQAAAAAKAGAERDQTVDPAGNLTAVPKGVP